MKIILYNNHSENNKLNKTIVKIVELDGYLREQTSLVNPQIMIEFHPDQFSNNLVKDNDQVYVMYNGVKITWDQFINNYVLSSNYVYIPDFNRYYFINDITSVRQNLWRLTLHVDVLMSYKKEIGNTKAFVSRNEFDFNPDIDDNLISYKYDKKIDYITPINLSSVTEFKTGLITPNTIVSYLTDDDVEYSNGVSALDGLPQINMYVSGSNVKTQYLVGTGGIAFDIVRETYKNDTLRSYLKSIVMYPYEIEYFSDSEKTTIKIGEEGIALTDTFRYPKHAPDRIVIADFIINRKYNNYRDFSPYTKYEFYIPYCSMVELSGESFLGDRIKVFYLVNYEDCTSTAYIYNVTKDKILFSNNATLGVKIGLSSSNATEIKDQKNALALNTALGVIGGVISVGTGIYSGNAYATATGALSITSSIGNAITKANQLYDLGKVEISSGVDGLSQKQQVYIKVTEMIPTNDTEIGKYYGKPLNEYRLLKDISGYTIVGNEHLENFGSATKQETEEIKTLLKGGVIL